MIVHKGFETILDGDLEDVVIAARAMLKHEWAITKYGPLWTWVLEKLKD